MKKYSGVGAWVVRGTGRFADTTARFLLLPFPAPTSSFCLLTSAFPWSASINRTLGFRFWPKIQVNDLHMRRFAGTGRDEFQICSAFLDQLRCDGEAHCSISV